MTTAQAAHATAQSAETAALRAADGTLGPDATVEEASAAQLELLAGIVAASVALHNVRATVLGDLAVASALTFALGVALPTLGLQRPAEDPERLRAAVGTLFEHARALKVGAGAERVRAQRAMLGRLARAEARDAVAEAMHLSILGHVDTAPGLGWLRRSDGETCDQCARWSDGLWRPATVRMKRHTGDQCLPVPITRQEAESRGHRAAAGREPTYRAAVG